MDRMILPLLGAIFLLILGASGSSLYYTHPPIHWRYRLLGIPVVALSLPDSLATRADQAFAARDVAVAQATAAAGARRRCDSNLLSLRAAAEAQNAAVEALGREGEARVAASAKAVSAARAVAESARQHAEAILADKPQSADLCAAARALIIEEVGR